MGEGDMTAPLSTQSSEPRPERRRYERAACSTAAMMSAGFWPFRRSWIARLMNLSEGGALIEMPGSVALAPGSPVSVSWDAAEEAGRPGRAHRLSMDCVALATSPSSNGMLCSVRFNELVSERKQKSGDRAVKAVAVIAAVALGLLIWYLKENVFLFFWYGPFRMGYSILASAFLFSRILMSAYYRPPGDNGYLPSVTMVIAAKNEEDCIARTVEHCFGSRYPAELLDVIAIDDGSTDKTGEEMERLRSVFPKLKLIRFPKNKGKRRAMAAGAEAATGEILVFVDSDSLVEPEGVYRIVQPFADKSIGAVSGHTLVDVETDNPISKMESVRYYISYRILKAAESVFGAVTCCPGAFSAYRRSAVMKILDAWLNQRFLGVQATFGDDRSLTNYILKTHQVIYHERARCRTKVPNTWMGYFKQQHRWKKSWFRETTVASRRMFKEHPFAAFSYYAGVVLTLLSPVLILHSFIYLPLVSAASPLQYVGGLILAYLFLGLVCLFLTGTRYWVYGLSFAFLYICILSWQNYYAMFTVNDTAWGTR